MLRWLVRRLIVACALSGAAGCSSADDSSAGAGSHSTSTETSTPAKPEPTPKGTPIGEPTLATIGPEGGTLASADGVLTVIVPPGALAAPTELSVQPITNTAPPSVGNAYRLTPEGHAFDVPVEIRFHYDEADLVGTGADVLGIAHQDEQGYWELHEDAVLDKGTSQISAPSPHFSDWSLTFGLQLTADKTELGLNDSTKVELQNCIYHLDGLLASVAWSCRRTVTEGEITELLTIFAADKSTWSVQGKKGGSPETGQVVSMELNNAIYLSPKTKPASPLTAVVSVRSKDGRFVTENIRIKTTDGWRIDVKMKEAQSSLPCVYGTADITDGASFTLVPGAKDALVVQGLSNEATKYDTPTFPGGTITVGVPPVWDITKVVASPALVDATGKTTIALTLDITRTLGVCTLNVGGSPVTSPPQPPQKTKIALGLAFDPKKLPADYVDPTAKSYTFTISKP